MNQRLALFYHIWATDSSSTWPLLIDEQLKRVYRSGLADQADIYCCISGPSSSKAKNFVSIYDWVRIISTTDAEDEYEGYTLKFLYEKALEAQYAYFGYFHTKGLSHQRPDGNPILSRASNSWRHMMEAVVLDRWQDAISKLSLHDVAGANFRPDPWPHFAGNFWWATSRYLQGLPHPHGPLPESGMFNDNPILKRRTNYERWIGVNNPIAYDFYSSPLKFLGKPLSSVGQFNFYHEDVEPYYRSNMRG